MRSLESKRRARVRTVLIGVAGWILVAGLSAAITWGLIKLGVFTVRWTFQGTSEQLSNG